MRLIDADAIELKARMGIEEDGLLFIPYADVKKSIDNTPTISQWIPVSERLPQDVTEVLLVDYDGFMLIGWCEYNNDNGLWWNYMGAIDFTEIIAWMPLPEPYKESENND